MNIPMIRSFILVPLFMAVFTVTATAQVLGDREYQYEISDSGTTSVGYDLADAFQFGSQQRIPNLPGVGRLSVIGGAALNNDSFGESTTVATILSSGEVLNGRYSWDGGSEELGIAIGST